MDHLELKRQLCPIKMTKMVKGKGQNMCNILFSYYVYESNEYFVHGCSSAFLRWLYTPLCDDAVRK